MTQFTMFCLGCGGLLGAVLLALWLGESADPQNPHEPRKSQPGT